MKQTYIYPEMFEHTFTCYVKFFGLDIKVICAFDDPDDVFVWIEQSMHHISYDLSLRELERIHTFAHEYLETL